MKAALILCALALASASPRGSQGGQQTAEKQKNLLQLFVNVQQPNYNQQQREYGNSFQFNKNQFNNYHAVKQFQNAYEQGLLPRGQVFNYNNPNQLQQAIQLFDVFYFANDYETFYQAACWARERVNEGQFIYALSVAIAKRQDTQGVALPPQSEVYPFLYVNAKAIQQAQNNKQQGKNQYNARSNHTNNYVYNQQHKQQQQQQQHQQQNQYQFPYNNNQNQNNDYENQANQYQNQQENNYEGRVAYFSEDVALNQQFANQQIYNPNWFNSQKYNQKSQNKNGENFYYYLQQVLARYNLERYANDLPKVQPFQFNQNIQPGYNPQLQYNNGQAVPARPNNVNFNNANANNKQQLQNLDKRIAEAVDSQQIQNNNGAKQALNADNGVELLGNLVQANENSVNTQYYAVNNGLYGYFDVFRKAVGSIVDAENQNQAAPGAIENNSAALRDPVFYQIIARIVNYFQNFKNQQQPYKQEQINFQGVEVQSVKVDDLETYFDDSQVDLYNAINYQQGEQAEQFKYKAQQQRLNNKPFNYNIQVHSEQNTDAIVRVFIGPQFDVQGNQYSLEQARQNFVEIDRFVANLKNGHNQIQRNSQESTRFVQQQPSTFEIYNQAQQGNFNFNQSAQYQQQYTLPQNLILPKGSHNGQQYVLAVAINQYQPDQQQAHNQHQPSDSRAQGFPFDRQVQAANFQQAKNIYFQTVTVYNKNQNNQ